MASAAVPAHAIRFDQAPEASDFLFGSVLGQGSYAKVSAQPVRCCHRHTQRVATRATGWPASTTSTRLWRAWCAAKPVAGPMASKRIQVFHSPMLIRVLSLGLPCAAQARQDGHGCQGHGPELHPQGEQGVLRDHGAESHVPPCASEHCQVLLQLPRTYRGEDQRPCSSSAAWMATV